MKHAARVFPFAALDRRYLRGGRSVVGGFCWDAEALAGLRPTALREQLGLDWRGPDGAEAFPAGERLGFLRFPVTEAVQAGLQVAVTAGAGGSEPDPAPSVRFTGTGFTPGPDRIVEYRLDLVALPGGSEVGRITASGAWVVAARWTGRVWERR